MRIILILMCGLLLQNCSSKNARIKSPNDLKSFVNEFCTSPKNTSTDKVKFASVSIASGSQISGTLGSLPETYFIFQRLGDT